MQRLADSWRSSIGSSAISVLNAYFDRKENLKDSDEARVETAEYALDKLRFCYKKAESDDEEVSIYYVLCSFTILNYLIQDFRGLYQGTLIAQTFAEHFCAIHGAREIPGVYDLKAMPCGALALSIAAVSIK